MIILIFTSNVAKQLVLSPDCFDPIRYLSLLHLKTLRMLYHIAYRQSWAPATSKVAALPLFGKKSSGAAAYRYSNKKVAPLPLLARKTAAAAACRHRYFKKINSKKSDGIQIRYLMVKFQLYLRKLIIQAFKISDQVTIGISRLKW